MKRERQAKKEELAKEKEKIKTMSPEDREKYLTKLKEQRKREKELAKKEKKKIDKRQVITGIIAAILLILMLASVCGTLVAYLIRG